MAHILYKHIPTIVTIMGNNYIYVFGFSIMLGGNM